MCGIKDTEMTYVGHSYITKVNFSYLVIIFTVEPQYYVHGVVTEQKDYSS